MLVKCPNCGTLVSDKAAKCPKCGISLKQESPEVSKNNGIIKILTKAADISSKYSHNQVQVSVFSDNFSIDSIIDIIVGNGEDESSESDCAEDFEKILRTDYSQYSIKKEVSVPELVGNADDRFKLYTDRPEQVYKAEWGQPYTFVMCKNNKAAAVVMLGDGHSHNYNVKYLISRMYAKKLGIPYINFYTQFPNTHNYVVNRINKFLNLTSRICDYSIQVKDEELKKMNLVSDFGALPYYSDFSTNYSTGTCMRCATVRDAGQTSQVLSDILTKVFKKKIEASRFVISIVGDNDNSAKYNSDGDFLEGKGYGQGEFAYYKVNTSNMDTQHYLPGQAVMQDENNIGRIIGIVGIIVFLILTLLGL